MAGRELNTLKECSSCHVEKPLEEFSPHAHGKYGRQACCKVCNAFNTRKWNSEHPEEKRLRAKAWNDAHAKENSARACKWAKEHPEQHKERNRKWEMANSEKVKAGNQIYYTNHREQTRNRLFFWRREHPEKVVEQKENRRARKMEIGGTITAQEWSEVLNKYDNKCLCCGRKDVKLTMDHVIPLGIGPNTSDNVQPLCQSCNSKKGRKAIDYR